MPIAITSFTPAKLAKIAWTQLRESGVEMSADAIDMLETYILEGYAIMEGRAGYDPEAYAVPTARMVVRSYAMHQYLSIGPKNGQAAENARRAWESLVIAWDREAAKEYHKEQADLEE